jgi:hypothetical protein
MHALRGIREHDPSVRAKADCAATVIDLDISEKINKIYQ